MFVLRVIPLLVDITLTDFLFFFYFKMDAHSWVKLVIYSINQRSPVFETLRQKQRSMSVQQQSVTWREGQKQRPRHSVY
jgi:hypothetical protein